MLTANKMKKCLILLLLLVSTQLFAQKENMSDYSGTRTDDGNKFYFDFESIKLNNHYSVDALGIPFIYNEYEIAPWISGTIHIKFTYDELKPFVKKSSPLWYLFDV